MEVGDRQQLRFAAFEPGLGRPPLAFRATAVAARVVSDARVGAVLASLDMAAERGGSAHLDGAHDATLTEAQVPGIGEAPCVTVAAENVRHLKLCSQLSRRSGRRQVFHIHAFERALDLPDRVDGDPRLARRGSDLAMPGRHPNRITSR